MQAYLCVCVFFFLFFLFFLTNFFHFFLITMIKTKLSVGVEILQPNFVLFLRGGADSVTVSLD